jgi:ectoine hydroxylase-related dioxygenase (phytanoyl-CoA dioxygenase family)
MNDGVMQVKGAAFRDRGYDFPLDAISPKEAAVLRQRLEQYERVSGGPINDHLRHKSHLLFTWLNDLIRHPKILDAVAEVIGPDILCWSTSFFIKEPQDPGFVSWHQDATYWGLSEPEVITAWVAFTPSNRANGCMRVIPGSHRTQLKHVDTFAKDNLLTRGQEIAAEVEESQAVDIVLSPGQFSLHHVLIIHGSDPNPSDDRRIGFAIRYISTRVKQTVGQIDSATLVRGMDRFGHFRQEPRPLRDFDPEAVRVHSETTERKAQILYAGTDKTQFRD